MSVWALQDHLTFSVLPQGKIETLGRLLLQDTFMVSNPEGVLLGQMTERRVFLFEQMVIFSKPLDQKAALCLPGFLYRNSIKVKRFPSNFKNAATKDAVSLRCFALQVSCLGLEETVEGDRCKFILTSRSLNGITESFVLHSSHLGVHEVWTLQVRHILGSQRNCLPGKLCTRCSEDVGLDLKLLYTTFVFPCPPTKRIPGEPCRDKQFCGGRQCWFWLVSWYQWRKFPESLQPLRVPGGPLSALQDTTA